MNMGSYNCGQLASNESQQIQKTNQILKVLADESRLKILCILKKDKHCVCEIEEKLDLSQSLISHQMADLRNLNIVKYKELGRRKEYQLTKFGQKIINFIFKL